MTLERTLKELGDLDTPLRFSGLLQLSGLFMEEVHEFKALWLPLPPSRKCEALTKLAELTEDNLALDFAAIFRVSLEDEHHEVREKATRGLWECEDRVMIRPLVALLEGDPSEDVRAAAAVLLGRFAEMAQRGKILGRDAKRTREALLSAIGKEDEGLEVRRRAIEAVACFNTPQIKQMIHDAHQSGNSELKQSAIYGMGRTSDNRWLPTVLEGLEDEDSAIRYEAAIACGQLGEEPAVPHLIALIEDDELQVQLSVIQALGAIGGILAKQALLRCLQLGDEALEEAASAALKSFDFEHDPLGFQQ